MISSRPLRNKKQEGRAMCLVVVVWLRVGKKPGGRSVCAKLSSWERAVPLAA
jgi:hypothetical protein